MILKEIKQIWDYITNNDVSDLFGDATPTEILDFYIYWDVVEGGMSVMSEGSCIYVLEMKILENVLHRKKY